MKREELHHLALSNEAMDVAKLALSPHLIHVLLSNMGAAFNDVTEIALRMMEAQLEGIEPGEHAVFSAEASLVMRQIVQAYKATLDLATDYERIRENCSCEGCQRRRQQEVASGN